MSAMRIPDEMYAEMLPIAKLRGMAPGALLAEAWERWWQRNGDRIVDEGIASLNAMRPSPVEPLDREQSK